MRAWVLEDVNNFHIDEVELPTLKSDEVLVEIHAAGICGSDIQRVYENGAHKMPLVIGHEFSGRVVKTGSNGLSHWQNQRVGVFPLLPCKKCVACKNKKYELCSNYNYLGSRTNGGFTEYVAVPVWNIIALPENVTYEQAAMAEPMAVAVHAMRRVQIESTTTIAIVGLGTIGLLLTMFLLERGCTNVFVVGKSDYQKEMALSLGVAENNYIDGSNEQNVNASILKRTNNQGVDCYFDCVGKNTTIARALEITAPLGTICMVGNPYSDVTLSKDTYWKLLRRQLTITGTWNSSFLGLDDEGANEDDWHYVFEKLSSKRISPEKLISHNLQFDELEKGFIIMRDKLEPYTKILFVR